jgi:hypothetical protein
MGSPFASLPCAAAHDGRILIAQLASSGWLRPEWPGKCLDHHHRRPALYTQHTAQMKDEVSFTSKPMPSTGKTGQPAFPRSPPNRICRGLAKIDANEPKQTLTATTPLRSNFFGIALELKSISSHPGRE